MSNQTTTAPVEVQSMGKQAFVGLQMLFVAFGALVLVPLITGLNSNTALLTAGIGTLLFQLCTGNKSLFSWPPLLPLLRLFNMVYKLGAYQPQWVDLLVQASSISHYQL